LIWLRIVCERHCDRICPLGSRRDIARAFLCVVLLFGAGTAYSQELTPRANWPAPQGTKILLAGYAYSTGDIVTDPSLPLVGVDSTIRTGVFAYQQTISLAGRTTNLQFELPHTDTTTIGEFRGDVIDRETSGIGDVSATISVNLTGAPTMTRAEFQAFRQNPKPILATSLKVVAPTGEYEPGELVNIGTNRWAAKFKLSYLHPIPAKLVFEMTAGVWVFQDNDEFLGVTREQEPITAIELNLVKRFRPGFWASIDANYYSGGRTIVDDDERDDFQRNSRLGFTLVYPFAERHAIKASYSAGVATESGGDYNTFVLNYLYRL
jgi:hypothetical protein